MPTLRALIAAALTLATSRCRSQTVLFQAWRSTTSQVSPQQRLISRSTQAMAPLTMDWTTPVPSFFGAIWSCRSSIVMMLVINCSNCRTELYKITNGQFFPESNTAAPIALTSQ